MCKVLNIKKSGWVRGAIYIGRSKTGNNKWGNQFVIGVHGNRREVIQKHADWLRQQDWLLRDLDELRGKDLLCFCADEPCHGDLYLWLANASLEERDEWKRTGLWPKPKSHLECVAS